MNSNQRFANTNLNVNRLKKAVSAFSLASIAGVAVLAFVACTGGFQAKSVDQPVDPRPNVMGTDSTFRPKVTELRKQPFSGRNEDGTQIVYAFEDRDVAIKMTSYHTKPGQQRIKKIVDGVEYRITDHCIVEDCTEIVALMYRIDRTTTPERVEQSMLNAWSDEQGVYKVTTLKDGSSFLDAYQAMGDLGYIPPSN